MSYDYLVTSCGNFEHVNFKAYVFFLDQIFIETMYYYKMLFNFLLAIFYYYINDLIPQVNMIL